MSALQSQNNSIAGNSIRAGSVQIHLRDNNRVFIHSNGRIYRELNNGNMVEINPEHTSPPSQNAPNVTVIDSDDDSDNDNDNSDNDSDDSGDETDDDWLSPSPVSSSTQNITPLAVRNVNIREVKCSICGCTDHTATRCMDRSVIKRADNICLILSRAYEISAQTEMRTAEMIQDIIDTKKSMIYWRRVMKIAAIKCTATRQFSHAVYGINYRAVVRHISKISCEGSTCAFEKKFKQSLIETKEIIWREIAKLQAPMRRNPRFTWMMDSDDSEYFMNDDTCMICYREDMSCKNCLAFDCGHAYCTECVGTLVLPKKELACPTCRKNVSVVRFKKDIDPEIFNKMTGASV
tara:strand:- start:9719 stop:10765 length:1047 start_codon:yes stop_codon:yes gene_type:complete